MSRQGLLLHAHAHFLHVYNFRVISHPRKTRNFLPVWFTVWWVYFEGINFRGNAFSTDSWNSAFCSMHACDIKFVGINVRGTCLIRENYEHFIPLKYTHYTVTKNLLYSGYS